MFASLISGNMKFNTVIQDVISTLGRIFDVINQIRFNDLLKDYRIYQEQTITYILIKLHKTLLYYYNIQDLTICIECDHI